MRPRECSGAAIRARFGAARDRARPIEGGETRLAGASASVRPCVSSASLRAPEDSVEQYAIAATRKNSRAPPLLRVLVSTTTNTYPNNQPGESKSSKPASVLSAKTTNANFTKAVTAAHAPRTG